MRTTLGLLLGAIVIIASACVSSTPAVPPSVNVTGSWEGDWSFQNMTLGAGTLSGTFKQDGSKLSGNFLIVGGGGAVRFPAATVIGFVSGNQVILSQPSSGTLTVSGNTMTGTVNGLDPATITLHKKP